MNTRSLSFLYSQVFVVPILVAVMIGIHLVLQHGFGVLWAANAVAILGTLLGSFGIVRELIVSIRERKIGVDYIAIGAISVALFGEYYLVGAVIALMVSGGAALESYGVALASQSLTNLVARIPSTAQVLNASNTSIDIPLSDVNVGDLILIKKGGVIPLDGILVSPVGEIDESSVTGEPFFSGKQAGDSLRSGTVNQGDLITLQVTTRDEDSSYRKIIQMVENAQAEKSPLVRLANQYSLYFLGFTLVVSIVTYVVTLDMSRVLAVLVIATPCPLILATPIALMGGVSAASKANIIVKKWGALEVLSRLDALVFDKTGTLTLGTPTVTQVTPYSSERPLEYWVSVAAAIERSSLHPLAKAVFAYGQTQELSALEVQNVREEIGFGIFGDIDGRQFYMANIDSAAEKSVGLFSADRTMLARFDFKDALRPDTVDVLKKLNKNGLRLYLFTGDRAARARDLADQLGVPIAVEAECSPERKRELISILVDNDLTTAMIGDGVNDAPALATAHVGLVFSNHDQTAATDAADVVFLGGDLSSVLQSISLATRTIRVAKQCIFFGMGASGIGMIAAALGTIPPIFGAVLQEAIDIIVIVHALRTSVFSARH